MSHVAPFTSPALQRPRISHCGGHHSASVVSAGCVAIHWYPSTSAPTSSARVAAITGLKTAYGSASVSPQITASTTNVTPSIP